MKLNNNGWGYLMMIFLMVILCLFLLVAAYFIYRFYNNFDAYQYNTVITQNI